MVSACQITLYQMVDLSHSRKTCEHVNARAALHDTSAHVGMFASRFLSSQQSKIESFSTIEKGSFHIIPLREAFLSIAMGW